MDFGPYILLASLEGAVTAAVLALTAVGLSLVFGVMRVVNIAHGEFFMLGAVIAWWVAQSMGGHPAVGFAAALVIAPLAVAAIAVAPAATGGQGSGDGQRRHGGGSGLREHCSRTPRLMGCWPRIATWLDWEINPKLGSCQTRYASAPDPFVIYITQNCRKCVYLARVRAFVTL